MKRYFYAVGLLSLSLLFACGGEIEPGRNSAPEVVIAGLKTAAVQKLPLPGAQAFVATVESPGRSVVVARTDGRVATMAVKEGAKVRAGDVLLTLEGNLAQDQQRQAEAGLLEARGALEVARAQQSLAEKTEARYRQLFAKEAVTLQEMDQISSQGEIARQGVAAADAAVQRAEAARAASVTALGYSRLVAPFDAVVVERQTEIGSTVLPGMPLLVLDRQGEWLVRAEFPEALAGALRLGQGLQVEIPALNRRLPGTVSEILPVNPASRSFPVKALLADAAGLGAGMFARVVLASTTETALLIPRSALVSRGQLQGVFVVKDGRLHFRLVKTGRDFEEQTEILSGLQAEERVVTAGAERARSGARVEE